MNLLKHSQHNLSQSLWRLHPGYVIIILVTTLSIGLLVSYQVSENKKNDTVKSLAEHAEFLSATFQLSAQEQLSIKEKLSANRLNKLSTILKQIEKNTQSKLAFITLNGDVISSTQNKKNNLNNISQKPEFIAIQKKSPITMTRFDEITKKNTFYYLLQIKQFNHIIGFVRVTLPISFIEKQVNQLRLSVLFGTVIAIIIGLVTGVYFSRKFSVPLTEMTELAGIISQGDYNKRIIVQQQSKIKNLAESFNRMAENYSQRMTEITTAHERLTKIFAGMVEGVIGVDQKQNIIHVNHAAAKLLKLSINNSVNRSIWSQVKLPEVNKAMEQAIKSGEVITTQVRPTPKSHKQVINIYAAALLNDNGEHMGAVIVLNDISELDNLTKITREFAVNASHELKTPITAIRGLTETILDDKNMKATVRNDFICKIHTQSLRLSSLVADLLTISRLDSIKTEQHFQSFNLCEVVNSLVALTKTHCQQKQLKLNIELPTKQVLIYADKQAITQLINNLIENAIQYTPAKGTIQISIVPTSQQINLCVKDSGIGIKMEEQKNIFERFYRVDKARSRALGGTGLGLSIVKDIIKQHQGSISLESELNKGSSFTVTLPLNP